jgi:hypothetical protein
VKQRATAARSFAFFAACGCALAVLAAEPLPVDLSRSDPARQVRPWGEAYRGPIVDTHSHLVAPNKRSGAAANPDIPAIIEKAHVARIVLLPPPNAAVNGDALVKSKREALVRESGGRVLAMCGSDYLTHWMYLAALSGRLPTDVAEHQQQLAADLQRGGCAGVGEIGLFHFRKVREQAVVKLPAAYPPLVAIGETAAKFGVPLDLHAESREPDMTPHQEEVFATIAAMFERVPALRLICSHTCLTTAKNARTLLQAYPGLMMNLHAYRNPAEWGHLEPVTDLEGRLYEDWAVLLDEMPDRFMIGNDFMFGWNDPDSYPRHFQRLRNMLGSLAPGTARKIAYENAVKVFGPLPQGRGRDAAP